MTYKDEKGEFIFRYSFTTRAGRKVIAKDKPFKIYIKRY